MDLPSSPDKASFLRSICRQSLQLSDLSTTPTDTTALTVAQPSSLDPLDSLHPDCPSNIRKAVRGKSLHMLMHPTFDTKMFESLIASKILASTLPFTAEESAAIRVK
jgi:hypothetical protein